MSALRLSPTRCGAAGLLAVTLIGTQPATATAQQRLADGQLAASVTTVLLNDSEVGTRPIDVRVETGVVFLSGIVATDEEAEHAVALARSVPGVLEVRSSLTVGVPEDQALALQRPRRSAVAGPTAPRRWLLGVGGSVVRSFSGVDLDPATSVGPLVRLRPRRGLGPAIGFSWSQRELRTAQGSEPALASLQVRPVMAGLAYGVVPTERLSATLSVVGGYSFNSLSIESRQPGPNRAISVTNSVAWRAGGSAWLDLTPRLGVNLFVGYLVARPEVTFASDRALSTRRVKVNSAILSIGLAYWVF